MGYPFYCQCGQLLSAEAQHAGLQSVCPKCRQAFVIPADPNAAKRPQQQPQPYSQGNYGGPTFPNQPFPNQPFPNQPFPTSPASRPLASNSQAGDSSTTLWIVLAAIGIPLVLICSGALVYFAINASSLPEEREEVSISEERAADLERELVLSEMDKEREASFDSFDDPIGLDLPPIPKPPVKPLVWRADYTPVPIPQYNIKNPITAMDFLVAADEKKASANYAEAQSLYFRAIELDPNLMMARYQLACCYDLDHQTELAASTFRDVVANGFGDYGVCVRDNELMSIRQLPDFRSLIDQVRGRYASRAPERVLAPIAFPARGKRPSSGYPVMVILADNDIVLEAFFDESEQWASRGFVTLLIPGSFPTLERGARWNFATEETTHQDVQAALGAETLQPLIDTKKVFLFGMNNAAVHVSLLLANYSSNYQGAVMFYPSGSPRHRLRSAQLNPSTPKPIVMVEYETNIMTNSYRNRWMELTQQANWPTLDLRQDSDEVPLGPQWNPQRRDAIDHLLKREGL